MNPQATTESVPAPSSEPVRGYNPLEVMQPNERVICEITRHPFGLLGMYLVAGVMVLIGIAVAAAAPAYLPVLVPNVTRQTILGVVLSSVLLIIIALLYGYIVVVIYKGNRWIVTSDSITEITKDNLFGDRSSQLSLANLEDVTVEQEGLIQEMVGFGTLHVETAGEHSKFIFSYCPDPKGYARKIIAAHEEYIAMKPQEMQITNRPLADVQSFNQPSAQ